MFGLPGDWIRTSTTHECEKEGCEHPAYNRLQGETDSFGAEYSYWCDEHKAVEVSRLKQCAEVEHACDACGEVAKLYPTRDWEEGLHGPVYNVCAQCRPKYLGPEEEEESDDECCEWCGRVAKLETHRDWEDGSSYELCGSCRQKNVLDGIEALEEIDEDDELTVFDRLDLGETVRVSDIPGRPVSQHMNLVGPHAGQSPVSFDAYFGYCYDSDHIRVFLEVSAGLMAVGYDGRAVTSEEILKIAAAIKVLGYPVIDVVVK